MFGFVGELINEGRPTGIIDRFCEPAARQSLDVQIFDGDESIAVDQTTCELMLNIRPLVADMSLRDLKQPDGFTASSTIAASSPNPALGATRLRFRLLSMARIRDGGPVAQRREVRQPDVDADSLGRQGQRRWCHLNTETGEPFGGFALDRQRLDRSLDRAVQLDLDCPDF
jgi:hypothetical protein